MSLINLWKGCECGEEPTEKKRRIHEDILTIVAECASCGNIFEDSYKVSYQGRINKEVVHRNNMN